MYLVSARKQLPRRATAWLFEIGNCVKPNDEQATTLGILLAGYLQRQKEARRELWDGNADILCRWPLTPLGIEVANPNLPELGS